MNRQKGFILAFVITALALVALVMFVLAGGANVMLFHADSAYLQAVNRNLAASGLAWARVNIPGRRDLGTGQVIELDTAGFTCPGARLTLRILAVQEGNARIQAATSCRKGRRTLNASRDSVVPLPSVETPGN